VLLTNSPCNSRICLNRRTDARDGLTTITTNRVFFYHAFHPPTDPKTILCNWLADSTFKELVEALPIEPVLAVVGRCSSAFPKMILCYRQWRACVCVRKHIFPM
jgi:hypothetical protein